MPGERADERAVARSGGTASSRERIARRPAATAERAHEAREDARRRRAAGSAWCGPCGRRARRRGRSAMATLRTSGVSASVTSAATPATTRYCHGLTSPASPPERSNRRSTTPASREHRARELVGVRDSGRRSRCTPALMRIFAHSTHGWCVRVERRAVDRDAVLGGLDHGVLLGVDAAAQLVVGARLDAHLLAQAADLLAVRRGPRACRCSRSPGCGGRARPPRRRCRRRQVERPPTCSQMAMKYSSQLGRWAMASRPVLAARGRPPRVGLACKPTSCRRAGRPASPRPGTM